MPFARPPRRVPLVCLAALFLLVAIGAPLAARAAETLHEGLIEETTTIPAIVKTASGARPFRLAAYLARPEGPGPFPVVVLTHGAPRQAMDRALMRPDTAGRQARDFAHRGWATVSVMRRGYGPSEGPFAEDAGGCAQRDYEMAGRASAEDLRGAIGWIAAQPWADAARVLVVGVSAGGFAATALSADPPPGLAGIVSFAGGRGSRAEDDVCQPERLVGAFRSFGRTARVPALWIYAENDRFFGPALARAMHAAHIDGGAPAELMMVPPFGEDGHALYAGAPNRWWPIVDRFLRARGLPTWSPAVMTLAGNGAAGAPTIATSYAAGVMNGAGIANGAAVNGSTTNGSVANGNGNYGNGSYGSATNGAHGTAADAERLRDAFERYLAAPGEKAMATAPGGAFGWATGRLSTREARAVALDYCRRNTTATCRLRFVNLAPVP